MKQGIRLKKFTAFLLPLSLFASSIISFNCISQPNEPKAPTWTTQLTLKLLTKDYYFGDVVAKDSKFDTTSGAILYKPIANDIGSRQGIPASVFEMPAPRGNTISQEIGAVPVHLGTPPTVAISASQLGLSSGTVPAFAPDPSPVAINEAFGDSTAYKYLIYESGQMQLTVTNNFQFSIQFVGNTVQLVNVDDTTQIVGTFTFSGPITAGTTAKSSIAQLTGIRMYAGLKMKGSLQIINWAGKTINSTDNITSTLGISNALIQSALINTLEFNDTTDVLNVPDSSVLLDDSIQVKLAKFQSGSMNVRITNHTAFNLTVEFKIPELIDNSTNKVFQLQGTDPSTGFKTIPPNASFNQTVLMKDENFISRNRNGGGDTLVTQYLHFTLGLKTLSAGVGYALVNKTDFVVADVQPVDPFVLEEVQGKVPPTDIAINQTIDAGIGDIGNKLSLTAFNSAIQLGVKILSTGLFPTDLNLNIYPVNKNGIVGSPINVQQRILPGESSTLPISSDKINTLMNSFVNVDSTLPSKFLLQGTANVDPIDVYLDPDPIAGIGSVKQTDSLFVSLDYAIPVELGIQNGSLKDTTSLGANLDTAQINLIESGKIYFNISNTFPVAINLKMNLLKPNPLDSSQADPVAPPVLSIPQSTTDPTNYPPISVPSDTTVGQTGVQTFTFLNLSASDATKLAKASFAAIDMQFNTGKNLGLVKTFKKSDKIHMEVFANISFNVDFDRLKSN